MIHRSRTFSRYVYNNLRLLTIRSSISVPNKTPKFQIFSTPHLVSIPKQNPNFCSRGYCNKETNEFTEEIDYLDESGSVIYTGKGVRSVEPGVDDHIMIGGLKQPFSNAAAVAKIVEIVKRWKWGPEMETQLDKLQFVPNMIHVTQALKVTGDGDACLSLFKWAKRQSWYAPSDECYLALIDRLNHETGV